jgi:hypothetical protein
MAQNFDAHYRTAARSARRKIEAVLPEALPEQVGTLQNQISFVAAIAPGYRCHKPGL